MKKLFLFCIGVCLWLLGAAQKVYFLYLQTDDQAPFYVRMADKIYSSSTAGYLILPNLTDSTYSIALGFPKSTQPETRFAVAINQNDKGYLVKSFPDGLSLFDMQELSVVKSVSASRDNTVYETKTDKFSSVLSKAANDPSLLKVAVAKKEEPKPEPEKKEPLVIKDDSKLQPKPVSTETTVVQEKKANEEGGKPEQKAETSQPPKTETGIAATPTKSSIERSDNAKPPATEKPAEVVTSLAEYKPSTVVRRSESSTTEGFGIVYLDKTENKTDTVRILIPPSRTRLDQEAQTANLSEIEKKPETVGVIPETLKPETNEAREPSEPQNKQISTNGKENKTEAATNLACKELASDKDFMKLRKNMAAKSTDEDMIFEAKKVFRNRCFTAEQIRYLSTLFLTSSAKYQFFDAAYNYVSDKANFAALQSEIKDEYFLKRFKALVGE